MTSENDHLQGNAPEPANRAKVEPVWRVSHEVDPARLERALEKAAADRPNTEVYRRT